ncbi:MAG: type IV pili methyl-accepting chemotaxis transducer N-terminal domain-containing protein [Sulfuricurvum sp.]|uniref:type IV pili methyl-accepting chemotaxis transducer N-terminal domain-containing protein n=1 Tax=Sulfuricurvum sp. TaxID=2025608 RepID=UPI002726A731|nr:type IV pili methyl-accepting chemotaxis transducer N-terminal domain-containing protein [Sulfuricurvum sp.]MDO9055035.1 type IV pili methyl-accepting chemotaxis transducer N-terminal domain-containing protein [Sulfuricurvum sp.]MDP2850172.1 type IV pili methyl-accepting chemotaxis transducer N-terminal domain-containing protein [Sulfuricurvum sp.]MDP3291186.1 type IV pili methyl-accepting chemotaxis transducer N-terminal domain-containing protein [Sulfuricurvum sp.]
MQSISTKIRWMVAILSINLITIILVDIWLNSSQKLDAKVINTAGKQRMLSQRTVLELHRLLVDEEGAYERLESARAEFDNNFKQLNMAASDYRGFSNDEIDKTMMEVHAHWNRMGGLIDRYLQGDHNLFDLKTIYDNGDQTLSLMDKAVSQYEDAMMGKRLLAHRIQIFLAFISFGIILYMARTTLEIQRNFDKFLDHSQMISGVKNLECRGNELDVACSHIEYFLRNVEEALQSAADAVEKSEAATLVLVGSTPEAEAILEQNEDVMIQVSEELHQTSMRLKKLKNNLEKANSIRNA